LKTALQPSSSAENSTESAYHALIRTIGFLRRAMEPYFTLHGISLSQWAVLQVLNCAQSNGDRAGLRLTDLSERLLVRPPSVTGVVDRLQRMGLVTRAASKADHRSKMVSLTSDGRQLVERVMHGHAKRVQGVLGALNVPEQRELHKLLTRLGDHLETLAERES
jgi:DNA-binding MarR family transcriptional regulator